MQSGLSVPLIGKNETFSLQICLYRLIFTVECEKKMNIDDLQNGEKKKEEREGHGKGETEREVERERVRRKRKRIPVCSPPGGASGNMNERTERVCH